MKPSWRRVRVDLLSDPSWRYYWTAISVRVWPTTVYNNIVYTYDVCLPHTAITSERRTNGVRGGGGERKKKKKGTGEYNALFYTHSRTNTHMCIYTHEHNTTVGSTIIIRCHVVESMGKKGKKNNPTRVGSTLKRHLKYYT